jgi:ribosomal protein L35
MPKLKTKKTLVKRIKITKNGKIMKKQSNTGHLKRKWTASRKSRKGATLSQDNKGHIKVIKTLLGKLGRGIK